MKIWKIIAVITIAKFCKSNVGLMVESRLVSNTGDESELEAASHMSKQDLEDSIGKKNSYEYSIFFKLMYLDKKTHFSTI